MKKLTTLVLAVVLGCMTFGNAMAKSSDTIKIGYFDWSDNLFVTNVINYILTEKMDVKVKLIKADPALVYQGVAKGDLDLHADAWLPETHADYMKEVGGDVIDVGSAYTHARLGWVVPDYVPEDQLSSIEDLKNEDVKKKLDGKIYAIDPGAGLTRLSKQAMEDYGLSDYGYELKISSDAGMTSALKRAIRKDKWVVVTGWSPHWMFGRWDLRYIDDPKGTLGDLERADILVRKGFYVDHPEIYQFLNRMEISLDDVEKGMYEGEESSYKQAAKDFVENNPKVVNYWINGTFK